MNKATEKKDIDGRIEEPMLFNDAFGKCNIGGPKENGQESSNRSKKIGIREGSSS